jgi:hypothetical protein
MTKIGRRLIRRRSIGRYPSRQARHHGRRLFGESLESRVLLAGDLSYHNVLLPSDVDRNGLSSAIDVLIIVNELNMYGSRPLYSESGTALAGSSEGEAAGRAVQRYATDTNNDGYESPLDALYAVNRINDGEGQGDAMKYVLRAVDAGGNPLSTVSVGGSFTLQVWVDDLRSGAEAKGVFAGYLDVLYDASRAAVSPSAALVYGPNYQNGKSGELRPGVVDHAGAFDGLTELGPDPLLLWSLSFVATSPGDLFFRGESATNPTDPDDVDDGGGFDTLLFGQNIPTCPTLTVGNPCLGSVGFDPASPGLKLTVVQDITAVNDNPPAVNEDSQNNVIDVLANDIMVPKPGAVKQLQSFDATTARGGTVARHNNGTPSNTSDDRLLYTPKANDSGADTFTYTVANGLGATSKGTVTVQVLAVNDPPSNITPGNRVTNEDQPLVFAGSLSVSDVDADAGGGLRVTLTASHGKLAASPSNATVPVNNASTITVTGLVADVNAALNGLTYSPDADYAGTDTLVITTNDLGHTGTGGPLSATNTLTITINAVNDPPVNHLPPAQETDEEVPLVMSATNVPDNSLSVIDVDLGSGTVQVALSLNPANAGVLALSDKGGLSFTDQDGDASMTFSGTLSAVNVALAKGLTYTPATAFVGSVSLAMTTTSQGQSDQDALAIEVVPTVRPRAINDSLNTAEDGAASVVGVLANDRPHSGAKVTLLSFTQPTNGEVTRNDNGTPADLTDDTLSYKPDADFSGADPFTYTINDTSGLGVDSTATVAVNVQPVNDAPVLALPGNQTINEDQKPPFAPLFRFPLGSFHVDDIDAAAGNLTVSIVATLGVVDIVPNGAAVQGSGTAHVTVVGTLAQVNATLSDVAYRPNDDANGTEVLTVTANDGGNTGVPGPLTDTGSVTVNITPVNDPPTNQMPAEVPTFVTNFDNILSKDNGNEIQVDDVDDTDLTTTLTATRGTLAIVNENLVQVVYSPDKSSVTLTGPQDAINQTLADGVIYRVATEGPAAISVVTTDAGALSDEDAIEFEVVDFVPSTIAGMVYMWGDKDRDHVVDADEVGARLAGVKVSLAGTTFRNRQVAKECVTGTDGKYSFTNLEPGSYQIQQEQPYGVLDGEDLFEAPVTGLGNDVAGVEIGIRGGVNSTNNNFTEIGMEARYVSIWNLLASAHDPRSQSGFVFALGEDYWSSLRETASTPPEYRWSGSRYTDVWFELVDSANGILHAFDIVDQKAKQAIVTVSSGRMLPSSDYMAYLADPLHKGCVVTVIGGPSDFNFTDAAAGGEGESSAVLRYRQGVDALFAGYAGDADRS